MSSPPANAIRLRPALITLCALGCAVLLWRGAYRGLAGSGDLAIIYSSARAWLHGANPYDAAAVGQQWLSGGGAADANPGRFGSAILLYPPPTFVLLAPLAALPWAAAAPAWIVLTLVLYLATLLALARIAGLERGSTAWWGLMAGGAWLAPVATNLMVGQLAVATVALVALAHLSRVRCERRSVLSGLLLGLATALKPQIAGLFIVYEAGRLRWRRAAWALLAVAVTAVIGIGRMEAAGVPWRSSWTRNLGNFTTVNNGDPTRANVETRFHIVSLNYPLHNFTDDRGAVKLAVYGIVGALCLAYFLIDLRRGRQHGEGRPELISLSMVAVVSLMVVYHRFYDAVLLAFPLALTVANLSAGPKRRPATVLLLLLALFAAPGASILAALAARGTIPPSITGTRAWEMLILPYQAWALPLIALALLYIRWAAPVTRKST